VEVEVAVEVAVLYGFLQDLGDHSCFLEGPVHLYLSGPEQQEALDGLGRLGEGNCLAT
jgi:hypothetical protein